jgi:hypothetical protein
VIPAPGLTTAWKNHSDYGVGRRPQAHFQPGTGAPQGAYRLNAPKSETLSQS